MIHASWIRALGDIEKLSTCPEAKRLARVLKANLAVLFNEQLERVLEKSPK